MSAVGTALTTALVIIDAHVTAEVCARVAGSGDIVVRGNPPVRDQRVAGSGKIKFR